MQYDSNAIFYKFRHLDDTSNFMAFKALYNCEGTKNNRFKQILQTSLLHASKITTLNDIEEGTYNFVINDTASIAQDTEEIWNLKNKRYICSFSRSSENFQEDLLWAHYANEFRGVRIDFTIAEENSSDVRKVNYESLGTYENINLAKQNINTIMLHKNKCWEYENEYRALLNEKTFPIKIKQIVLGKRICNITLFTKPDEKERILNRVRNIAKLFRKTLADSNKYDEIPKIYAYKLMYSNELFEVN